MFPNKMLAVLNRSISYLAVAVCLLFAGPLLAQEDADEAADADPGRLVEEIVVYGIAYGANRALQQQRDSNTLVTVVSEETLETIPEQSIGEALSRLPGVSITRDRGEANFITIRGADSRLNAVSMNGDRLLSPESTLSSATRGKRTTRLNTLPATLISQIEVFKAVPPNMDADSVGGAVNVSTKSATQLNETLIDGTVRYGYNDLPEDDLRSGEFTWGSRLNAAGNMGLIVTASYEETNRGISGLQAEWGDIDEVIDLATGNDVSLGEDHHVIETFDVIWRGFSRTRKGFNMTFDWAPSETSLIKFGGWWSDFEEDELRRRLQIRAGASADFTTDTIFDEQNRHISGSTDGGRIRKRIREGILANESYNYFLEGNHVFGDGTWTFDWRASHSFADQSVNRTRARFEARAQDIGLRGDGVADFTFTNGNQDFVQYTQPAWADDPDILHVGRRGSFRQWRNEISEDEMDAVKFDIGKTLAWGETDVELAFGYKGSFRDRALYPRLFFYDGVSSNPTLMSEALGPSPHIAWEPFGYEMGIWSNAWIMDDIFWANPDRFSSDGDTTDQEYFIDETVHAAYVMGTFTKGRWTTIVGARFEDTETEITARDGEAVNAYSNFIPAVITRFNLFENTIVRAAWTHGLGRPDFVDLRPFFSDDFEYEISDDTGLPEASLWLNGGNPDLNPFEAQSFDLSIEHYFATGGVISAGIFHKQIENFEFSEELRQTDVTLSSLPGYLQEVANAAISDARSNNSDIPANLDQLRRFTYIRPINGDDAELTGYELNYQQQFVDLPGIWSGFGVFANYTYIDGESNITDGISRDFLIGQFEDVLNFQLFYEVEAFTARVAYNRNGVTYAGLGIDIDDGEVVSDPNSDVGIDVEETWDFAFQYRRELGNGSLLTVFFDIQNFTDENSRNRFLGSENLHRFIELENGGRSYNLGVRWNM